MKRILFLLLTVITVTACSDCEECNSTQNEEQAQQIFSIALDNFSKTPFLNNMSLHDSLVDHFQNINIRSGMNFDEILFPKLSTNDSIRMEINEISAYIKDTYEQAELSESQINLIMAEYLISIQYALNRSPNLIYNVSKIEPVGIKRMYPGEESQVWVKNFAYKDMVEVNTCTGPKDSLQSESFIESHSKPGPWFDITAPNEPGKHIIYGVLITSDWQAKKYEYFKFEFEVLN
jgi:hypothetical protein